MSWPVVCAPRDSSCGSADGTGTEIKPTSAAEIGSISTGSAETWPLLERTFARPPRRGESLSAAADTAGAASAFEGPGGGDAAPAPASGSTVDADDDRAAFASTSSVWLLLLLPELAGVLRPSTAGGRCICTEAEEEGGEA